MGSCVAESHNLAHTAFISSQNFPEFQSGSEHRSCPVHLYSAPNILTNTEKLLNTLFGDLNKFELKKFNMSLFHLLKSMTLNGMLLKKLIPRYSIGIFLTLYCSQL